VAPAADKVAALAWLLRRSPVMLPIPGTSSMRHLEQNMSALDAHRATV
jgi:aryl-alcohol dehydrogenase-like predicted oxidoreductase